MKSDEQVAAEWAAAFVAAQAAATSDFEREVLADGVITEAEYDEAVQRYVACGNDRLPAEFAGDLVVNFGDNAVLAAYDPSQATGLDLDTDQATTCRVAPWVQLVGDPPRPERVPE